MQAHDDINRGVVPAGILCVQPKLPSKGGFGTLLLFSDVPSNTSNACLMRCQRIASAQGEDAPVQHSPIEPQCLWIPLQREMPSPEQYGHIDFMAPNPGLYEFGQVSDGMCCVEKCTFNHYNYS